MAPRYDLLPGPPAVGVWAKTPETARTRGAPALGLLRRQVQAKATGLYDCQSQLARYVVRPR